jgi:periplasmic divalent cation tolerance protein
MSGSGAALVWSPFPDEDSAAAAAETLLSEGMIACANLLPGVRSLYHWQGQRGEAREVGALFKTTASRLAEAIARLGDLHPYQTPAVLGWTSDEAAPATLAWLEEACAGASG